MKWLLYIVLFLNFHTLYCQSDTVILSVDVLGQEYPTTSYHHAINGQYLIKRNKVHPLTKKQLELFRGFEFINPTAKLIEGKSYVQANSLRHYIDVDKMVYLQWDSAHYESNLSTLKSFKDSTKEERKNIYSGLVQSYFEPFFIHRTEVTNYQYRQFVNWVRDSILMEAIYLHYPDFNTAKQLLDIPNDINFIDTNARKTIRQTYHLNFSCKYRHEKVFDQLTILRIIKNFYLSPSERWYKRKEVDVNRMKYSFLSGDSLIYVNIYPDTTKWYKDHPQMYNDPMANMYFWHPVYDNYPVVGVSKVQAESFCLWKQQQFQVFLGENNLPFDIKFELPNTKDYENTIRYEIDSKYEKQIEDNEIVTDLHIVRNQKIRSPLVYSRHNDISVFLTTNKVYIPSPQPKTKKERELIKRFTESWDKDQQYDKEFHDLMLQRVMENYIDYKIYFLSNNVSEWLVEDYETNYEALARAYINYNCFSSIDYCEGQRIVDEKQFHQNDTKGNLIMGANWYDERYGSYLGVNKAGLYPKTFKEPQKSFATVGFRYVIRVIEK